MNITFIKAITRDRSDTVLPVPDGISKTQWPCKDIHKIRHIRDMVGLKT